MMKLTFRNFFG